MSDSEDSVDKALDRFGLTPHVEDREAIRQLLIEQIERDWNVQKRDYLLMNLLCTQLFALANLDDTLLIWRAKQCDFDAACGIDVELLCGGGFDQTRAFLKQVGSPDALDELKYLQECEESHFRDFSVDNQLAFYRRFYRLSE